MNINKNVQFDKGLNEVSNPGYRYAVLSKPDDNNVFNIRHKLARCKDYIQDIYWSEYTKKDVNDQYGFYWKHDNNDKIIDKDFVDVLLVPDKGYSLKDKSDNIIKMLNILENELNIPNSTITFSSTDDKDIIITYNNKWAEKPYLISLYFLLLRASLYFKGENLNDVFEYLIEISKTNINKFYSSTVSQLNSIIKQDKLKTIFIDKILPDNNYKDSLDQGHAHNYSGIMNVSFKLLVNNE